MKEPFDVFMNNLAIMEAFAKREARVEKARANINGSN